MARFFMVLCVGSCLSPQARTDRPADGGPDLGGAGPGRSWRTGASSPHEAMASDEAAAILDSGAEGECGGADFVDYSSWTTCASGDCAVDSTPFGACVLDGVGCCEPVVGGYFWGLGHEGLKVCARDGDACVIRAVSETEGRVDAYLCRVPRSVGAWPSLLGCNGTMLDDVAAYCELTLQCNDWLGTCPTDLLACPEKADSACQPKTQGFWKRQCEGPHPSGEPERLSGYAACVDDARTFAGVADAVEICDRLHPQPNSDKCEQAEAQFMALELNACSGRLAPSCCTSSDREPSTVVEAVAEVDALLANPDRGFDDCVSAQAIADGINSGRTVADCTCMGRLVLDPITVEFIWGSGQCVDGQDVTVTMLSGPVTGSISAPCDTVAGITLEGLPPGDYVIDIRLASVCYEGILIEPLSVTVPPCGEVVVPAPLWCRDAAGCDDACGGG